MLLRYSRGTPQTFRARIVVMKAVLTNLRSPPPDMCAVRPEMTPANHRMEPVLRLVQATRLKDDNLINVTHRLLAESVFASHRVKHKRWKYYCCSRSCVHATLAIGVRILIIYFRVGTKCNMISNFLRRWATLCRSRRVSTCTRSPATFNEAHKHVVL